ncbi:hypothetical protein GSI_00337 [Ganoderma sinense ZZ0214-1]|uniref:Uncharacterized protein n=1 Tax=Ganoderma sinense ZZ0214-1 TaxID=1077348 RepID=A0A2G8SSU6_9APHY|nr:hypothetical protein GSI_00337 [Ganoderma sinense ZZ0214-1]
MSFQGMYPCCCRYIIILTITDLSYLQDQSPLVKPTCPPSIDSDNPSWATLSTANTSSDEDALDLESQATTPEPVDEKALSSYTTTLHSSFPYQQPTSNYSPSTTSKNCPSTGLKRGPSPASDTLSAHALPAKKAKKTSTHPLHQSHNTLLDHQPLSTHQSGFGILPRGPITTLTTPLAHLTTSQKQQLTPFSSHEIHTASLPSALTHQVLQPRKPLPPITNSSGVEDWALVDDALGTQVASAHNLRVHRSTQFLAPWEPESSIDAGRPGGAHFPLTQFADLAKGSKGKERARSGWTAPRWSNVGDFKARLDAMYGPGDINRGLGRGPKNIPAGNAVSGTAPDQPTLVGLPEPGAAQGSALTEDEDEPDMSLGGMRRGRLENLSPQRDTRASWRHGAAGKGPEIE